MDQERFDKIALALSRRRVLGGSVAGLLGVATATLSEAEAKKKGKAKRKKGKVGADFTCTAGNAAGACGNDACCNSTAGGLGPQCVSREIQEAGVQQLCGNLDGEGVCRTCPPGTVCGQDGNGDIRCLCLPSTCPDGCCIDNRDQNVPGPAVDDQCIRNGSGQPVSSPNNDFDGSFVCGRGGSLCNVCSLGTIFSGCCTEAGQCNGGTAGTSCGSGGRICQDCTTTGGTCGISQSCSGSTTTTTTTTTVAPLTGCGPGTADPCTNGCCAETSPGIFRCEFGGGKNACGKGGVICKKCGGRRKCSGKGTCKRIKR